MTSEENHRRGYLKYYGHSPSQYASNTSMAEYTGPIQPYMTHNDYTGYGRQVRQLESHTPYSPYDSRVWSWSPPRGTPRTSTDLYSKSLKDLCTATRCNLAQLKLSIIKSDPCYEYGIKHWHPGTPDQPTTSPDIKDFEPPEKMSRSKISPRWKDTSVFFGDGKLDLSKDRLEEDDLEGTLPKNKFCYFCSTMEEHKKHLLQFRRMKPEKPKKANIVYVPPPPFVKKKKEDRDEGGGQLVLYRVKVKTGILKETIKQTSRIVNIDTGTNAKVEIKIKGTMGTSSHRHLRKKVGSLDFYFGPGSTETFHLRIPDLGDLQLLKVRHNGKEEKDSWFLDEIEVTNLTTQQKWLFRCHKWLSLYKKDCTLERVLKSAVFEEDCELKDYEIIIETSKVKNAGTSANVSITMYSGSKTSEKIPLYENAQEKGDYFKRGKVDVFKVEARPLGKLTKIRIEHDNKGNFPDWHFNKIQVNDLESRKAYYFLYNDWLVADERLGKAWVDLFPAANEKMGSRTFIKFTDEQDSEGHMPTRYDIIVITGKSKFGSGTDANVYMQMFGKNQNSPKIALDQSNNKDPFESGMTDVFQITSKNVGPLKKLIIGHDNANFAAGWFLDKVIVRRYLSNSEILHLLTHTIRDMHTKWMKKGKLHIPKQERQNTDSDSNESDEGTGLMKIKGKKTKKNRRDSTKDEEMVFSSRRGSRRLSLYSEEKETLSKNSLSAKASKNPKKKVKESSSSSDSENDKERGWQKKKKEKKKSGLFSIFGSDSSDSSDSEVKKDNSREKSKKRKDSIGIDKYESNSNSGEKRQDKRSSRMGKQKTSMDDIEEESSDEEGKNHHQSALSPSQVYQQLRESMPYCEESVFMFNCWLAKDEGDGKLEHMVKLHESNMHLAEIPNELQSDVMKVCKKVVGKWRAT